VDGTAAAARVAWRAAALALGVEALRVAVALGAVALCAAVGVWAVQSAESRFEPVSIILTVRGARGSAAEAEVPRRALWSVANLCSAALWPGACRKDQIFGPAQTLAHACPPQPPPRVRESHRTALSCSAFAFPLALCRRTQETWWACRSGRCSSSG
jgi:hypothetical protein